MFKSIYKEHNSLPYWIKHNYMDRSKENLDSKFVFSFCWRKCVHEFHRTICNIIFFSEKGYLIWCLLTYSTLYKYTINKSNKCSHSSYKCRYLSCHILLMALTPSTLTATLDSLRSRRSASASLMNTSG